MNLFLVVDVVFLIPEAKLDQCKSLTNLFGFLQNHPAIHTLRKQLELVQNRWFQTAGVHILFGKRARGPFFRFQASFFREKDDELSQWSVSISKALKGGIIWPTQTNAMAPGQTTQHS